MLIHLRKNVCIALVVSAGCLPLATLHAQTMGAENSAVVYNDQGDIRSDSQSSQYRYNALNQLIYDQATQSNKTVNYQYYATGIQATESVETKTALGASLNKQTLYHYYAGQSKLLNSVQSNNISNYLLANGTALRAYQNSHGLQTQVFLRNRHRSVISVVSHTKVKTQQYNAYGNITLSKILSLANNNTTYDINTNPLRYSNYLFDSVTSLYYLKARYYSPHFHTFLSRDNYDLNNRYWYGDNNPLMGADPSGHVTLEEDSIALKPADLTRFNGTVPFSSALTPEVTLNICSSLEKKEIGNLVLVSKRFYEDIITTNSGHQAAVRTFAKFSGQRVCLGIICGKDSFFSRRPFVIGNAKNIQKLLRFEDGDATYTRRFLKGFSMHDVSEESRFEIMKQRPNGRDIQKLPVTAGFEPVALIGKDDLTYPNIELFKIMNREKVYFDNDLENLLTTSTSAMRSAYRYFKTRNLLFIGGIVVTTVGVSILPLVHIISIYT